MNNHCNYLKGNCFSGKHAVFSEYYPDVGGKTESSWHAWKWN